MDVLKLPDDLPGYLLLELDDCIAGVSEANVLVSTLAWCAPYLSGAGTTVAEDEEQ